jgi:hypothetical protein
MCDSIPKAHRRRRFGAYPIIYCEARYEKPCTNIEESHRLLLVFAEINSAMCPDCALLHGCQMKAKSRCCFLRSETNRINPLARQNHTAHLRLLMQHWNDVTTLNESKLKSLLHPLRRPRRWRRHQDKHLARFEFLLDLRDPSGPGAEALLVIPDVRACASPRRMRGRTHYIPRQ